MYINVFPHTHTTLDIGLAFFFWTDDDAETQVKELISDSWTRNPLPASSQIHAPFPLLPSFQGHQEF